MFILDSNSSIPDPVSKWGRIPDPDQDFSILVFIVSKLLEKMTWDVHHGSGYFPFRIRITDSGVKTAPDPNPGSESAIFSLFCLPRDLYRSVLIHGWFIKDLEQQLRDMEQQLDETMAKMRRNLMVIRLLGLLSEDNGLQDSLMAESDRLAVLLEY